jgi:hypothetical protein
MTTLYEVTDRLIGEQLDALLPLGWQIDELLHSAIVEPANRREDPDRTMRFVRLISAARLLYQQHTVDRKGLCGICPSRSRYRAREYQCARSMRRWGSI